MRMSGGLDSYQAVSRCSLMRPDGLLQRHSSGLRIEMYVRTLHSIPSHRPFQTWSNLDFAISTAMLFGDCNLTSSSSASAHSSFAASRSSISTSSFSSSLLSAQLSCSEMLTWTAGHANSFNRFSDPRNLAESNLHQHALQASITILPLINRLHELPSIRSSLFTSPSQSFAHFEAFSVLPSSLTIAGPMATSIPNPVKAISTIVAQPLSSARLIDEDVNVLASVDLSCGLSDQVIQRAPLRFKSRYSSRSVPLQRAHIHDF